MLELGTKYGCKTIAGIRVAKAAETRNKLEDIAAHKLPNYEYTYQHIYRHNW